MKKIIIFVCLILVSCNNGTPSIDTKLYLENRLNQNVIVEYFKNGSLTSTIKLASEEKKLIEVGTVRSNQIGILGFNAGLSDSVKITFEDKKCKIDRYSDRINSSHSSPSMYIDKYYTEQSCGKNCLNTTYTIDEKDYAEAK